MRTPYSDKPVQMRVDLTVCKDVFQEKRDGDDTKFIVDGRDVWANKGVSVRDGISTKRSSRFSISATSRQRSAHFFQTTTRPL